MNHTVDNPPYFHKEIVWYGLTLDNVKESVFIINARLASSKTCMYIFEIIVQNHKGVQQELRLNTIKW